MKRDRINYAVVGLFVLVMGIGLAIVLAVMMGRTADMDPYHIFFGNVTGIQEGTPVSYEGFQIGKVQDIQPEQKQGRTRYSVRIVVQKGWQIPDDSLGRINASGLLAQVTIDIVEGKSKIYLKPGDEIKSTTSVNVFEALGDMAQDVESLTRDSIRPLMERLFQGTNVLVGSLENSAPQILANLEGVTRKLNDQVLVDVQATTKSLRETSEIVKKLLRPENQKQVELVLSDFRVTASNFKEISQNARQLSENMKQTNDKLDALLDESTSVVKENRDDIRRALTSLRVSLDTTARQMDSIASNLERASRNVSEFSREIRRNPSMLLTSPPSEDSDTNGD
ncbi:MAG TPA: MlaD family protein [Thermodesulfovibrionia bacterium]|nr:MlaD family protein [Thermodesulfovibrionia bacterium]